MFLWLDSSQSTIMECTRVWSLIQIMCIVRVNKSARSKWRRFTNRYTIWWRDCYDVYVQITLPKLDEIKICKFCIQAKLPTVPSYTHRVHCAVTVAHFGSRVIFGVENNFFFCMWKNECHYFTIHLTEINHRRWKGLRQILTCWTHPFSPLVILAPCWWSEPKGSHFSTTHYFLTQNIVPKTR